MITLLPMDSEAFVKFADTSAASYAHDNVLSGRWPASEALEMSRAEFEKLLPQGLDTPDNFLFEIREDQPDAPVGVIWLAVIERGGVKAGYVYQLEILPEFRRRGYAKAALLAAEDFCVARGLSTIGLHVFEHNAGAQALYRSLGYRVASVNMVKALPGRNAG